MVENSAPYAQLSSHCGLGGANKPPQTDANRVGSPTNVEGNAVEPLAYAGSGDRTPTLIGTPCSRHRSFREGSLAEKWIQDSAHRSNAIDFQVSHPRTETYPSELPERPVCGEVTKKGLLRRLGDGIRGQIDPQSIIQLLDFRPWFWPITPRKYLVLFLIACLIAGIVVSDFYFHWISKSMALTRSYMLPVLIISVCAEPAIIAIILLVGRLPDIPREEIEMIMGNTTSDNVEAALQEKFKTPSGTFETALVIPCHDTDQHAIKITLNSAFPHFRPQDIFIVDNGKSQYPKHPSCNFRDVIRGIHPDIRYIWSPIGSKNAAQLIGALAATEYKYIMTVDDDVCIPTNFNPPVEMINDKFKAVAYPIKAIDSQCKVPLMLVAWQDVEYRLSGFSKCAEDRLCGVQFPHGAGWFVERDSFITLLEHYHPMDFIAEDCNAGLGINRMGKGIRFDARSYLATEVPATFFGPGLNWWKQRQKSWEMGRHGRLLAFIGQFFLSLPPKKTPHGILWHKFTYFYLICTIIIDWIRIPTIVALGRTVTWWRNALLLMLFSAIPALLYKYVSCRRRPDMAPRFWACLTYPFYKQIYLVVSIFGAIRCIGYYWGGHQRPLTIQQMLKRNDERCFWLDPRFKTNPSFLADDGEELEAKIAKDVLPSDDRIRETILEAPKAVLHSPLASPSRVNSPLPSPDLLNPSISSSRQSSYSYPWTPGSRSSYSGQGIYSSPLASPTPFPHSPSSSETWGTSQTTLLRPGSPWMINNSAGSSQQTFWTGSSVGNGWKMTRFKEEGAPTVLTSDEQPVHGAPKGKSYLTAA